MLGSEARAMALNMSCLNAWRLVPLPVQAAYVARLLRKAGIEVSVPAAGRRMGGKMGTRKGWGPEGA
jgi:hypothetical protein